MALSSLVSRVPEKKERTSSILKKIKSTFSFRSAGQKKVTKDEVLENIIQKDEDLEVIASKNRKIFSYESLIAATNNFTHFLGGGGYGSVYKGRLEDGTEIAVKKLSNVSPQGRSDFLKEADVLTGLQHRNVVKLLGYCAHTNDYLLVYEFLPYTLNQFLSSSNRIMQLNWTQRLGIIRGIARGLRYLHVDNRDCIVHRDMKPNNVLLDQNLMPKIADLGLSRFFPEDRTHVTATNNPGTWGYMPPEYMELKHVSAKMDSYSFGVMMLELISGQQNFEFLPPPLSEENEIHAICLLDWAYELHKRGKSLKLLDPAIAASTVTEEQEQVITCIEIGLLCTQGVPKERPDMESVVSMLTMNDGHREASTILKPGVWGYRDYRYGNGKFSAQDHSDQSEAIMPADERQEVSQSQDNSAEIPHDMLVDEHQSQHGSSNSNQINLEDPQSNSNTFLAQHESASGASSQNEGGQSEAQIPKVAETTNDIQNQVGRLNSYQIKKEDPLNDSFTFSVQDDNDGGFIKDDEEFLESKDMQLEEERGIPERSFSKAMNGRPKEKIRILRQLMVLKAKFTQIRAKTIMEWEIIYKEGTSDKGRTSFDLGRLIESRAVFENSLMESLKVADTFESIERLVAKHERFSCFLEMLRGASNLENHQKQVLNVMKTWKLNRHVQSAKHEHSDDGGCNITILWEDMNKYEKELSLNYVRLKALGQKYEKGKWVLPSFLAHFKDSNMESIDLLEVEGYVKERLEDIDVGIECLHRFMLIIIWVQ